MQRSPITLEDYHNSRWVVEPLHLLDCTLVSNGGVAVIVTSAELAPEEKDARSHRGQAFAALVPVVAEVLRAR